MKPLYNINESLYGISDNKTISFNSFKEASEYFNIPTTSFKRKINYDYLGYKWDIKRL